MLVILPKEVNGLYNKESSNLGFLFPEDVHGTCTSQRGKGD